MTADQFTAYADQFRTYGDLVPSESTCEALVFGDAEVHWVLYYDAGDVHLSRAGFWYQAWGPGHCRVVRTALDPVASGVPAFTRFAETAGIEYDLDTLLVFSDAP